MPLLEWLAVAIEMAGLALIAVDIYLPGTVRQVRETLEKTVPQATGGTSAQREAWRTTAWIALYAVVWIVIATAFSAWDPQWGRVANMALAVITVLVVTLMALVSVVLQSLAGARPGAERTLRSMGLVTVLLGIALQVTQLLLA